MPPPTKSAAKKAPAAKKAAKKAPGVTKKAGATNTTPPPPQPTIDALLDQAVVQAQSALTDYRVLAENAATRLTGATPQPTTTWADDITQFWGMVMRDQLAFVKLWTDVLQLAAKS